MLAAARLLAARLERLSVDSIWARRSSGLRGSLLKWLEAQEAGPFENAADAYSHLRVLLQHGFRMLENAAREIRPPEERR